MIKRNAGIGIAVAAVLLACSASDRPDGSQDPVSKTTESLRAIAPVPAETPTAMKFLDSIPVDFLTGKFDPASHPDFVPLKAPVAGGSAVGAYLHRQCLAAFEDMRAAATAAEVNLVILSATRNFDRQRVIWEEKWNGTRKVGGADLSVSIPDPAQRAREILRYSSMPGTSRHHWGTDIDLNSFENAYFASGKGLLAYEWLQAHAAEYGFCQPYTAKGPERPDGYEEEKWHWSYLPLSRRYLEAYSAKVKMTGISGFAGAEVADEIDVIGKYVKGINKACF